jgi:hypothetical protein
MDRCDSCGKTGNNLKKCVRCESVMYCSKDCQRTRWKTHKNVCHPSKPAAATTDAATSSAASIEDALTINAVADLSLGEAKKKEYTDYVICQYCGVDASARKLACSKCKNTHYCGKECQVSFSSRIVAYITKVILSCTSTLLTQSLYAILGQTLADSQGEVPKSQRDKDACSRTWFQIPNQTFG